ncbi:MAG: uracil-DNA glycosylase [Candidatus Vogelbacteria bacterium CG10_big_fil_rev_8_21_14_0_10_51_16]|uniref:Uracil-DNA glycosylase n=1 Tax=Candidatus Vogelbacteria bacterium CG10_big_fil_rev_8_21_14_0_10_51_16 TaxID=1975045 RepID=A0A2H0REC5_9BACT|nr:MAG: uracil-DNA glycosylase [Candidatus Vogelbacteria bacterium CG10_big_fil_rev_8_21_14_0_10_51_16]
MEVKIEPTWKVALRDEFRKPYFKELVEFVRSEYKDTTVYPPAKFVFHAFEKTPLDKVKVVILGQDPYHGPGQAHGLSFSVRDGVAMPPSLQNIFKEIADDLQLVPTAPKSLSDSVTKSGNLEHWAEQGVLLLNSTLTVRAHAPGSHQRKGWETFTDAVIKTLSDKKDGLVFLLWGRYAQEKGSVVNRSKHLVLEAPHPSPLARGGFFGCKHFSKTNIYLVKQGREPILW